MDVYLQEMNKIMRKKYGYIVLVSMLLLKLFFGFFIATDSYDTDLFVEENKLLYLNYENKIDGKLTESKEKFIQGILRKQNRAKRHMLKIGDLLTEGKINMQEYMDASVEERKMLKNYRVAEILESQYQYVGKDRKNRFFVYQNGWINFFQKSEKDFICYACILFLTVAVFGKEFETEMHDLIRVCINGGGNLYIAKWGTAFSISILFSITAYLLDFLIAEMRYGLSGFSYPVQSISIFADCVWSINLLEMTLLTLFIKVMGTVLFASVIQVCCLCVKKTFYAVVLVLFVLIFPYLVVSEAVLYHLPVPICFFLARGFICGVYNELYGVNTFMSKKELLEVFGNVVFLTVAFIVVGYIFCWKTHLYDYKKLIYKKKLGKRVLCLAFFLLALYGCSRQEKIEEKVMYNYDTGNFIFENQKYIINSCNVPNTIKNKEQNLEYNLFFDVFLSKEDDENIKILYITKQYLYYIKYINSSDYDLLRLHLESLENDLLYSYRLSEVRGYNYLGLKQKVIPDRYHSLWISKNKVTGFWVWKNFIYIVKNDKVERMNLYTKQKKDLLEKIEDGVVSFYDGRIYYLTQDYELCCYSIECGNVKKLENCFIANFKVLENKIVFYTLDGHIGYCDNFLEKSDILEKSCGMMLDATDEYIYCLQEMNKVVMVDYQGETKKERCFPADILDFTSGMENEWYYVISRKDSGNIVSNYGTWKKQ